jgi:spore coat protein M
MSKEEQFEHDEEDGQFDEWMEKFYLDPHTNLLDAHTFRVDIFECSSEYLVEALFDVQKPEKIIINIKDNKLQIAAHISKLDQQNLLGNPLVRLIPFPFPINKRKIDAEFKDNILEIYVYKNEESKLTNDIVITL